MSDTPLTDGKVVRRSTRFTEAVPSVHADFARELERENTKLKQTLFGLMDEVRKSRPGYPLEPMPDGALPKLDKNPCAEVFIGVHEGERKSDTPDTDRAVAEIETLDYQDKGRVVSAEFARDLERRLNQLRRENEMLRETLAAHALSTGLRGERQ